MSVISSIVSRQVFDSRGTPTVEVELTLKSGAKACFICPSGASVGSREALELRDGDKCFFQGKGVNEVLKNIQNEICPKILHREFSSQQDLDHNLIELDGTKNKSKLGANAILPVSAAFLKASAVEQRKNLYAFMYTKEPYVLPLPLINVINGGVHANNGLDIQEFMLIPWGAKTFRECINFAAECFYSLKSLLKEKGFSTAVGDEGGFAPKLRSNFEALDLLTESIQKTGLLLESDVALALDMAANELYNVKEQNYKIDGQKFGIDKMISWYEKITNDYAISSIEDPFFEDDYNSFSKLLIGLSKKVQIVGDDLFVTNEENIRFGALSKSASAVLIKMNQVGTISETINAINAAKENGLNTIISHRSGDSEDTTIADFSVMLRMPQIKTGSLSRSERVAKYNRLLTIADELGTDAIFLGKRAIMGNL